MERQRSRYYRAGKSIVLKSLKEYDSAFMRDILKCETLQQMKQVAEKHLRTDSMEDAYKKIYVPVGINPHVEK